MSKLSNNQGRAFEFAFLISLYEEVNKTRTAVIEENSSFLAAKKAWDSLSENDKKLYKLSALSSTNTIFELEPLILEDSKDELILLIQSDDKGKEGDVRDILIIRKDVKWEIGLSIKHNHFAAKHSRLSNKIDFGNKWYGINCSENYWNDITPIFSYLIEEKKKGTKWKDLPNKEDDVYVPLLTYFKEELERQNKVYSNQIPPRLVEYLLGKYDFYKVISISNKKVTRIQSYNLRGNLNKNGLNSKRDITIPIASLPTRIIHIGFKPNSKSTLELYLDNGWQFNFRIHNASTKVEPSLKFDIQVVGMPTTIVTIDCEW